MSKFEKTNIEIIRNSKEAKISLNGTFTLKDAPFYKDFKTYFKQIEDVNSVLLDFSNVKEYDSFLAAVFLKFTEYCNEKNIQLKRINQTEEIQNMIDILTNGILNKKIDDIEKKESLLKHFIEDIGKRTKAVLEDSYHFVEFFGDLIIKFLSIMIFPLQVRWKDFPYHFIRAGAAALPIVILIIFLIGLITGYQGAVQLKQFGADIYIANLIGISITRELAPLMTAILVAGRSGSAFAAEIGTMKVSEEIDALRSMGFNITNFLVMPRVLGVLLAMPILTIIADIAGVLGGLIAAISILDVTISGYLNQLQIAVGISDILTGIIKSLIFGFGIAAVGCFRGMQVRGGAESVGKFTTASVVTGIFLIILFDSIFTFVFQALGI